MECFVANPAYCMQFLHASAMLAVVAERVCINVCSIHLPLQYVRLMYACMCVQALKIINRAKLIFINSSLLSLQHLFCVPKHRPVYALQRQKRQQRLLQSQAPPTLTFQARLTYQPIRLEQLVPQVPSSTLQVLVVTALQARLARTR